MTSPVRAPRVVSPSTEPGFDGFGVEVREQDAMGQPTWSPLGRILRDHGPADERVIFAALHSLLKIE